MTSEQQEAPADQATARLIARLWAAPTRPRRGPRPSLTVDRIVEAAFDLAEAEGLDAVTMARLGKALGVTPMALYRHVSNKDELLALLADRIARDLPPLPAGLDWRGGIEHWLRAQIDLALRSPWMLDLPLSVVLPGPNRLRWIDQAFGAMADLPITAGEKFAIIGLLAQYVLGEARVQVEQRRAAAAAVRREHGLPDTTADAALDPAMLAAEDPYADLDRLLRTYAEPSTYPNLLAAVTDWGDDPDTDAGDETGFGLHILLDGVEAYVTRRARERSRAAVSVPGGILDA